jgi:non-heme chloroperoxidase
MMSPRVAARRRAGFAALLSLILPILPAAAATPEGPVVQFGHVELSTGIRMHYAEQGARNGEAVILLHGYPDSWVSWSRVMPRLPADLHVLAPDLRGFGDTDRPRTGYAMGQLAADVVAFMDALGIPRATLVGHSMGTLVAQRIVLAAPERVTRLVLVGGGTDARGVPGILDLQAAVDALTDPIPDEFMREFQAGTVALPVPGGFMDRIVSESLKPPARVLRATLAGILAMPPSRALTGCAIPTLLVWGDQDAMFSRADQAALQELFVTAELRVYAGAGHSLHWEQPETFANDLATFLRGPASIQATR